MVAMHSCEHQLVKKNFPGTFSDDDLLRGFESHPGQLSSGFVELCAFSLLITL